MRVRLTTLVMTMSLMVSGQALAQPRPPMIPNFQRGQILAADELNRIVERLNMNTNTLSRGDGETHMVDCGSGETIKAAMDQAQPGDTIMIAAGTCNEAIVVNKDNITLDGGGAAVIDGAGIDRWAVDVTGRQKVTIQGLTVQNGHAAGIAITESSGVWMQDVTVRNTRRHKDYDGDGSGIFVGHASSVVLTGAIVADNNAGNGIVVWQSGNALAIGNFTPREITYPRASIRANGNGENGIFVAGSSSFTAFSNSGDNTTVHAKTNTYSGISVQQSSSVIVSGTDIEATNNQGSGLEVGDASSVAFWGGAGISVWGSSSFNVWDDGIAVNITSTNNTWRGLSISDGSLVS